jgi:glycosyltransferase involved in cell wall biosynthesis
MRLGVYSDLVYRHDGDVYSNNRAFIRFVTGLPPRVDEVVLFGRLHPEPGRSDYVLPRDGVSVVGLPYYKRAVEIRQLVAAVRGSCATFAREIDGLDAVWVFGPQPMSMLFAGIARRRGVPLVLGVRHDYPEYIRNRLPSKRWAWAVPVAAGMDRAFRLFARSAPTVALGEAIASHYRGGSAPVVKTGFSLVPRDELCTVEDALARSWDDRWTILTVSRLDPEKNPLLLLDVIKRLHERDGRWRLRIAGDGRLRPELEARIAADGLEDVVELLGEVPNGPELWKLYRESQLFLHVSLTEGLPQVLLEAQAAGLPIVGTAVGGVPEALAGGSGLLIPPSDADAAVEAVERLAAAPALRAQLIRAGLANAEQETFEAQLDRLSSFLHSASRNGHASRNGNGAA